MEHKKDNENFSGESGLTSGEPEKIGKPKKSKLKIIVPIVLLIVFLLYTGKTILDSYQDTSDDDLAYQDAASAETESTLDESVSDGNTSDQVQDASTESTSDQAQDVLDEGASEDKLASDLAYCESHGLKVQEIPGGLIQCLGDSDELIAGTVQEIDDRLGPAVTYDDIRQDIKDSSELKEEYKNWLLEGIDNLETAGLHMDLRILNYNFKRLKVQELSRSEIQEKAGFENTVAMYNMKDGTVYISNDSDPEVQARKKKAVIHEILGHGMTDITFSDKSVRTTKLFIVSVSDDASKKISNAVLGQAVAEGIADTIAKYAFHNEYDISYDGEVFQLECIRNLLDIDFSDLVDGGTTELVRILGEKGFARPQDYVLNMDQEHIAHSKNQETYDGVTVGQNTKAFFLEYAEICLKEDIKNEINSVFEKSSFDKVVVNSILKMDTCNVEDLKNEILTEIDAM